jgi:LysM repeat protein
LDQSRFSSDSSGLIIGGAYWVNERNRAPAGDVLADAVTMPAKPSAPAIAPVTITPPSQVSPAIQPAPQQIEAPRSTSMPTLIVPPTAGSSPPVQALAQPDPQPAPPAAQQMPAAVAAGIPAAAPTPAPVATVATAPAPDAAEPRYVTVAEGENLSKIAHANHVPVHALAVANHLQAPYELMIGDRLVLPDASNP